VLDPKPQTSWEGGQCGWGVCEGKMWTYGADHGDVVESAEFENLRDGNEVGLPIREVVAEPLADLGAGPCKCGSGRVSIWGCG
jgi:hypothetical protein